MATPDTARPDGAAENQRRAASGSETEGAEGAVALTPTKEAQDAAEAEKVARDKLLAKFAARSPATRLESGRESEPDAVAESAEARQAAKEAQDAAEAEKVARDQLLAKFAARATSLESGSESEPDARSKTSETGKPVFGLMSPSTEKAVKTKKKKKKQPPPSAVGGSDSVPLSPPPSPPSPDPPR